MRFVTVQRMLRNSGLSEKGIESVYEYMLGTPDTDASKAIVKRRWRIAVKRGFAVDAKHKQPLTDDQVQFILNQKQVKDGR